MATGPVADVFTGGSAEPLRRAQALGYRVSALQSSETGHPVHRRLDFQDAGTVPLFVRMPGG